MPKPSERDSRVLDHAGRPLLVGQLLLVGVGLGVGVAAVAQAARQQVAAIVDDGDLVRLQLGNRGGDQVLDRHDLLALERWPGRSFRNTLAVAVCWVRLNISRLGSTRWTRACWTGPRVATVRASSPSVARRWLTPWTKLVVPKPSGLS